MAGGAVDVERTGAEGRRGALADLNTAVGVSPGKIGGNWLERLFATAFTDLVYMQIWEDPVVDLEALDLRADQRMVAIASGGCNVLSYLAAVPAEIIAVDLNPAHVALVRLKQAAVQHLPTGSSFRTFLGGRPSPDNPALYDRHLASRLDPVTRAYWDKRSFGRRRIDMFAENIYARGLLGRFISLAHLIGRMHGVDPRRMLAARGLAEQKRLFEAHVAPLFSKPLIRWMVSRTISLYGLGIPPAQYAALAGDRHMAEVLVERLRRLTCDFDFTENYFARQAYGLSYGPAGCLPPYLEAEAFDRLRNNVSRLTVERRSITERMAAEGPASLDRYVLLDAQDWMSDAQLIELWSEITRTARPGARVIFRTAAEPSLLPGRLPADLLDRWVYEADVSAALHRRDRSAIYGGFHLYRLKDGGQ